VIANQHYFLFCWVRIHHILNRRGRRRASNAILSLAGSSDIKT
jgi:hypothetical protein